MASKKKAKRVRNDYEDDPGISRPKKIPKTLVEKDSEKRLIVVLENASLETIKVSNYVWSVQYAVCECACVLVRTYTCVCVCACVLVHTCTCVMCINNMCLHAHE